MKYLPKNPYCGQRVNLKRKLTTSLTWQWTFNVTKITTQPVNAVNNLHWFQWREGLLVFASFLCFALPKRRIFSAVSSLSNFIQMYKVCVMWLNIYRVRSLNLGNLGIEKIHWQSAECLVLKRVSQTFNDEMFSFQLHVDWWTSDFAILVMIFSQTFLTEPI